MKNLLNKGGLKQQAEKLIKDGDPIEDKILAEKLKLQIWQDSKKLNKKEFEKKYSSLTELQKKSLNISKDDNAQDIYQTANDFWDEKAIQNNISRYQSVFDKEKLDKLKQQELYNASKNDINEFNKLKNIIKEKYKYSPGDKIADPIQEYRKGVFLQLS